MAAEREIGVDPPLERSEAGGLEPLDSGCESTSSASRRGLAAPETECLAEQSARRAASAPFRLGNQPLETEQVELVGVEPDQIAGLLGDDRCAFAEQLSAAGRRGTGARSLPLSADRPSTTRRSGGRPRPAGSA